MTYFYLVLAYGVLYSIIVHALFWHSVECYFSGRSIELNTWIFAAIDDDFSAFWLLGLRVFNFWCVYFSLVCHMLSSLLKFDYRFWRGLSFIVCYTLTNQEVFLSPGGVVVRSKAIHYLHLVAATVERHDRNSGRRPVELSLLPFISQATSGIWRQHWPWVLASTRPVFLWRQTGRRV